MGHFLKLKFYASDANSVFLKIVHPDLRKKVVEKNLLTQPQPGASNSLGPADPDPFRPRPIFKPVVFFL